MKKTSIKFAVICLSLALFCCFAPQCFAHKLRLFAWQEGDQILGESKFPNGRAAKNIGVRVLDNTDKSQLLTTQTDESGNFSFSLPQGNHSQLEIVVDSGDGHRASWRIDLAGETVPSATLPQSKPVQPETKSESAAVAPKSICSGQGWDEKSLTALLETSLEKKLGPIRKELAEIREKKVTLQDILSGIGYIFGLAGLATYMKYRKNVKE